MNNSDHLKKVDLFRTLTDEELDKVIAVARRYSFTPDEVIFSEGDEGDRLYLLLSGSVRISKFVPRAGEEALAVLRAGDFFGEMALMDNATRSAHAISNENTVLLGIDRDEFHGLLRVDKDLAYSVMTAFCKTLSYRLRQMNNKIQALYALQT